MIECAEQHYYLIFGFHLLSFLYHIRDEQVYSDKSYKNQDNCPGQGDVQYFMRFFLISKRYSQAGESVDQSCDYERDI